MKKQSILLTAALLAVCSSTTLTGCDSSTGNGDTQLEQSLSGSDADSATVSDSGSGSDTDSDSGSDSGSGSDSAAATVTDTSTSDGANGGSEADPDTQGTDEGAADIIESLSEIISIKFTTYEQASDWKSKVDTTISLSDDGITIEGTGAQADGSVLSISQKGTYEIRGELTDGQIIVDVADTDKVRLVLNGVSVTCQDNAPLIISSADKAVLYLAEGSNNSFTDGGSYTSVSDSDSANACIYSTTDLIINGTGSLSVTGNYNNGIATKDDLKILGGTITVNALKNALKGVDSISIDQAVLNLTAGKDGIKSDKEGSMNKGFVYIKSGTITINAGDDGLQAFTGVFVREGSNITATVKGKDVNCDQIVEIGDGCLN